MSNEYIPLQYDLSHLQTPKSSSEYPLILDPYDLSLLFFNLLIISVILVMHFSSPKRKQTSILIDTSDRNNYEIPFFSATRQTKKSKSKDMKQNKQLNSHQNGSSFNLVELKCSKCSYSTERKHLHEPE